MQSAIAGVEFKELTTHNDDRGFFREIIRRDDSFFEEFGQWSQSVMYDNVIKAWHYHEIQIDYFYVGCGVVRVGLYDLRKESSTRKVTMDFLMGDYQPSFVVKIPPGIAHGVKIIQGPAHLFYMMTHLYNADDEYRIAYNDPEIAFDWISPPQIK